MKQNKFITNERFNLESGECLTGLEIVYHTEGELNKDKSNVIWICHALTANSDVADWWEGLYGEAQILDPNEKFIVCANIIGSCYGSTGPLSVNPETNKKYYRNFPMVTMRDMVNANTLLRKHLGIDKIHTVIGGSIGAFQALEWTIMEPDVVENLIFIASSAVASPWTIAFNESQRMAIESDTTFFEDTDKGGLNGMKTARSIALISYRNQDTYNIKQQEADNEEKIDGFRVCSYQRYQGEKLGKRFNAYAYYTISKAFDSHNVGRGRGGIETALSSIKANTLLVSISSDLLFPPSDLVFMKEHIDGAEYAEIQSLYGHDGFLLEFEKLTSVIKSFYKKKVTQQLT